MPTALWRVFRRSDVVVARLCAVYFVSSLPVAFVAVGRGPAWALFVAFLIGLLISASGAAVFAGRPISSLCRRIGRWQMGSALPPQDANSMRSPRDLRRLEIAFDRATTVLRRQQDRLIVAGNQQELLMQETHHRVKNNLQIIASLLNLQASRIRQPEARAEFQSARDRVRALATLHRHLYAHGEVHTIDMREFLIELCGQLFQAMGEKAGERLRLEIEAPELKMSSDQAVPLALIVTEAVSNAVKYAFPGGRRGMISVRLKASGDHAELEVFDDGVGIPAGRVETAAGTRDGIGIQLIRGFARQLGATLQVEEGNGTRYTVGLPLRRERVDPPLLGPLASKLP